MLLLVSLGVLLAVASIIVQVTITVGLVRYYAARRANASAPPSTLTDAAHLSGMVAALLVGHGVQVAIWAAVFFAAGEFETYRIAFYHSGVNFTSLGYGDLVMSDRLQLLGPLEAATGILMCGLSTALLFAVLGRMLSERLDLPRRPPPGRA